MTGGPPKVFISYSHDSVAHQERVLSLADRLRADGIDSEIDFRKVLKNKNSLPTEDSVRNLLYLRVRDITKRYDAQRVNGFAAYQVDLAVMWQKYYGSSIESDSIEFTQNT